MNLSLEKKIYDRYECTYCGSVMHEENTEMIVPDQSPDILRIVNGSGTLFFKDKSARDGKADVSGTIKGVVLYVAEGEKNVRKLDVTIPFAYVIDSEGITPSSDIKVSGRIRSFDVREINPRKISVKASVEVSVSAYVGEETLFCRNVADGDKFGVCVRRKNISVYAPVAVKEKSFSVSDDIELGSAEADMCEIVSGTVVLTPGDTKIIGNKAIIKGIADVSYIYSVEDGRIDCGSHELPFSQIMDIDGMEEGDDLKIEILLSGVEFEPQYDAGGKARYLTVSATADATATVYSHREIDAVEDAYSTKYDLSMKRDSVTCCDLRERIQKRVAVAETIETGNNVKRVLDASVSLAPASRRRDEGGEILASDASISVMYVGEDDSVYSVTRRATAVCPLPLDALRNYDSEVSVKGKSFSIGAGNEINVRFFTDFEISETERVQVSVISEMSVDEENPKNNESIPTISVKRLDSDCDLWMLAKEYSTTVEEIKMANDITDDANLTAGRMVLIPKKG